MNTRIIAVIIIFVTNFRICHGKRYDNYGLYRMSPQNVEQLKFLQNLEKQKYIDVIFWKRPHKLRQEVEFMVSPEDNEVFLERATHFGVAFERVLENVQEAFDAQTITYNFRSSSLSPDDEAYFWTTYHSLEDIQRWFFVLISKYPDYVSLESIGKSVENREIFAITIMRTKNPKGKVIVEGGIHGNEWVSTEFVTYLIDQLIKVNNTNTDTRLKYVATNYKWYLIPVLNPDGYIYSHIHDRLWRKNRRDYSNGGTKAVGVDLNRNFEYNFGKHGSSHNPSDDTYCGPQPFSEPETDAFRWFMQKNSEDLLFYFSIHSFGQKLIIPYADRVLHSENYSEMENFGKQAILKMYNMFGVKYDVGTTYDTLGKRVSGNSASWAKKLYKVKYVFTFVLRDNGSYGYALPPKQILPACQEAMTGLLEIMTATPKRMRADLFRTSGGNIQTGALHVVLSVIFWFFK